MEEEMKKTIITVVGKDSVGIIAKVCTYLAENDINILDISQTIVDGYFNMLTLQSLQNLSWMLPKSWKIWVKKSAA